MTATMTADSAIADSLAVFTRVREQTLSATAHLTNDQANYSPNATTWSVAQNLDHLLLAEGLYRSQISRLLDLARRGEGRNINISLEEVDLKLPFVPKAVMPLLAVPLTMFNMFVPSAVRETVLRFPVVKAKNPKMMEPAAKKSINVLRDQLRASLAETEALFAGDLPPNAERVTVSHPVFGRNTIANIIRLMSAHEERHGTQMARVMQAFR
jgi:uncharacterized damage-inducible protein DinB